MRVIRRLLFLTIVAAGGVAAYNYSQHGEWSLRPTAAALEARIAKEGAARVAREARVRAKDAASHVGDVVSDRALTAKIKSKMVLDDHVKARAINVDTSGAIVTLTGEVRSSDERDRALQLARETEGVTNVVDKLRIHES